MNILFINNSEINPQHSGIQRITFLLAKAFSRKGFQCYGANFEKNTPSTNQLFIDTLKLGMDNASIQPLTDFIKKHQIKRILIQECWPLQKIRIIHAGAKAIPDCKVYYCFHSLPGKEMIRPCLSAELFRLWHTSEKKLAISKVIVSLLPKFIYNVIVSHNTRNNYRYLYRIADKIVLLSERYIPIFQKIIHTSDTHTQKFIGIGNCLSFPSFLPAEEIANKKKEVIIVCRLSERAKRISDALKIWQQVESITIFSEWRLKIIGSGPDEKYYHHLAQKLGLHRVDFEGQQNPLDYYRRASICMITSAYEGFCMVISEAQQMGVVNIAFDTFASVHDTIEHNRNGIIVPAGNTKTYLSELSRLMSDAEHRKFLALNALQDCQRFSQENIIQQWLDHLQ